MHTIRHTIIRTLLPLLLLSVVSCEGILEGIYDTPPAVVPAKGQLIVDARSWTDWYYIDLPRLHRLAETGDTAALYTAQTVHQPWPIPMTLTGESDGRSGQYLYWFDVWGEGLKRNEFRSFTPCDAQPEPEEWSFAIHRDNVRTNGGAALRTEYTSMADLPPTSEPFHNLTFEEDKWSENDVWDSQEQMLLCLVPSQGIMINRLLSSWLQLYIPPIPPAFTHDSHVFIIRMKDGTYAALQLANYISPEGDKCWLTINYRYPY